MYPDALNCGYDNLDSAIYFLNGASKDLNVTYCQAYTPEQRCIRFYANGLITSIQLLQILI